MCSDNRSSALGGGPSDGTSSPASHRWFYRTGESISGPVSTEELVRDARGGRLGRDAEVRLESTVEWIRASSIDGLFSDSDFTRIPARGQRNDLPPEGGGNLSQLVAECRKYLIEKDSCRTARFPDRHLVRRSISHGAVSETLHRGLKGVVGTGSAALGIAESLMRPMTVVFPRPAALIRMIRSRAFRVGISALIVLAAGVWLYEAATRQERHAARLLAMASELRSLREASADETAWSEFAERVCQELDQLVPQLEQAAHAGNPTSIDLLWAARDYLPRMLVESRSSPGEAERQFDVCMRRVSQ